MWYEGYHSHGGALWIAYIRLVVIVLNLILTGLLARYFVSLRDRFQSVETKGRGILVVAMACYCVGITYGVAVKVATHDSVLRPAVPLSGVGAFIGIIAMTHLLGWRTPN